MKYQTILLKQFFWCESCYLLCGHSNGDIFTCEDNMLFSHVKISSFCVKAHLVFHWCLYNKEIYPPFHLGLVVYICFHSEELHTYHHCHYQPTYLTVQLQSKYPLHTPTHPAYTVNAFWYLLVRERMGQDEAM